LAHTCEAPKVVGPCAAEHVRTSLTTRPCWVVWGL